ncbi:MAG TPA: DUF3089 domain-containing protein [Allosphingosinicella sp.]|jgi:hypothetical protein
MIRTLLTGLALALALAAPAAAQEAAAAAPDYASSDAWLCLPGRDDVCSKPLPTTALNPNGYGSVGQAVPARDPKIDCFYVYPTVSRDAGDNSDLVAGPEEQATAAVQFARFAGTCRTFAPIYRQATLAALLRQARGEGQRTAASMSMAYGDVAAAWREYLTKHNNGRPFVLIGHSQGTIHLTQLLAREIEGKPEAKRMLSAVLIGFNVEVPEGKTVGGTFRETPLCTRVGETGCVVTYVSFRATNPPPAVSLFGRAVRPGMTVGCTNPARLAKGSAPLDSYWYAGPTVTTTPSTIAWSSGGTPPTPFLRTGGLASAACVNRGNVGYLSVAVNADPADARTDQIPGDVVIAGQPQPGWGLHLADMNLALGDLIALVEAQAAAFRR